MFGKQVVLVLGALGLLAVATFGPGPVQPPAPVVGAAARPDTLVGTVEIGSLKVISMLDDAGRELPPDSTLVPPVPIGGVIEVRLVFRGSRPSDSLVAGTLRP